MLSAESMLKMIPGSYTIPSTWQAMLESTVALRAISRTLVRVAVSKATSVVFGGRALRVSAILVTGGL